MVNIITTGFVSLLIDEEYNGAIAHALFYGLTKIHGFEKNCLHGDAVGYGVLVQLAADDQPAEHEKLRLFFKELGIPQTLKDTGYTLTKDLMAVLIPQALSSLNKNRVTPFAVTPALLERALLQTEEAPQRESGR